MCRIDLCISLEKGFKNKIMEYLDVVRSTLDLHGEWIEFEISLKIIAQLSTSI